MLTPNLLSLEKKKKKEKAEGKSKYTLRKEYGKIAGKKYKQQKYSDVEKAIAVAMTKKRKMAMKIRRKLGK